MKIKNTLKLLILAVPLLSIFFSCADYYEWFDVWFKRDVVIQGINRLTNPKNYPYIYVDENDPEFGPLINLILRNSDEKTLVENKKKGIRPSIVFRVGGTLSPDIGVESPGLGFTAKFVPDSSPVMAMYGLTIKKWPTNQDNLYDGTYVCKISDLRNWLEKERNQVRFILSTLLIGFLSFILAVFEFLPNETEPSIKGNSRNTKKESRIP